MLLQQQLLQLLLLLLLCQQMLNGFADVPTAAAAAVCLEEDPLGFLPFKLLQQVSSDRPASNCFLSACLHPQQQQLP
ncbi:hypothetical protein Emag_002472 [Eimeria magna]